MSPPVSSAIRNASIIHGLAWLIAIPVLVFLFCDSNLPSRESAALAGVAAASSIVLSTWSMIISVGALRREESVLGALAIILGWSCIAIIAVTCEWALSVRAEKLKFADALLIAVQSTGVIFFLPPFVCSALVAIPLVLWRNYRRYPSCSDEFAPLYRLKRSLLLGAALSVMFALPLLPFSFFLFAVAGIPDGRCETKPHWRREIGQHMPVFVGDSLMMVCSLLPTCEMIAGWERNIIRHGKISQDGFRVALILKNPKVVDCASYFLNRLEDGEATRISLDILSDKIPGLKSCAAEIVGRSGSVEQFDMVTKSSSCSGFLFILVRSAVKAKRRDFVPTLDRIAREDHYSNLEALEATFALVPERRIDKWQQYLELTRQWRGRNRDAITPSFIWSRYLNRLTPDAQLELALHLLQNKKDQDQNLNSLPLSVEVFEAERDALHPPARESIKPFFEALEDADPARANFAIFCIHNALKYVTLPDGRAISPSPIDIEKLRERVECWLNSPPASSQSQVDTAAK